MDARVLHILIVNNNPQSHADLIHLIKNSQQFTVDTVLNLQEALKKVTHAHKQRKEYALVFIDLNVMNATEVKRLNKIGSIDSNIEIFVCMPQCELSFLKIREGISKNDNFFIFQGPLDTLFILQLINSLSKKWILHKENQLLEEKTDFLITEKTKSLQYSNSLLRSTIEASTAGILVTNLKQRVMHYNSNFLSMWNIPELLIEEHSLKDLFLYMNKQLIYASKMNWQKNITLNHKYLLTLQNGSFVECHYQPHQIDNRILGGIWNFHDVTERNNLEQKLIYQASHDVLTGLPNRLIVMDRVQNALDRSQRNNSGLALFFIDLDQFKMVNDTMNHTIGDDLLRLIGLRLLALVRKEDTLARIGGDEFIMIIPDLKKQEYSVNVALKILKSFKEPFIISDYKIAITASIGISIFPSDGTDVDVLLKNADLAMYQAKNNGGNQFYFYTKELNKNTNQHFQMELELNQALKNKEFDLVYQPQFDMNSHKLISIEALLRWNHPQKGYLTPSHFIKVAELSGLIIPIGEWVLNAVCAQLKLWEKKKLPRCYVAINIASQQLKQSNFLSMVKNCIKKYKINPNYLEFEITEHNMLSNPQVLNIIKQLTALGIKIVLGKFGSTKSSLNYLKNFHINRLNLDHSFIKNIKLSRSDEVFIEAVIAMSRSFNIKVLAGGVENQNQMNYLQEQHCDLVQGFLLSKPLSISSMEAILKNNGV